MFRALLLRHTPGLNIEALRLVLSDVQQGLGERLQKIGAFVWVPGVNLDTSIQRLQQALLFNGFDEFVITEPQAQGCDEILYPVWAGDQEHEPPIIKYLHEFRCLERQMRKTNKPLEEVMGAPRPSCRKPRRVQPQSR